ncbi:transcriptional regulator family: Centromere protein B DNA-binding region [Penicillium capsulatum]|nr:transcriptional regulator family: Centromere protein B DNA-binding region [Penicillium capsulatum]
MNVVFSLANVSHAKSSDQKNAIRQRQRQRQRLVPSITLRQSLLLNVSPPTVGRWNHSLFLRAKPYKRAGIIRYFCKIRLITEPTVQPLKNGYITDLLALAWLDRFNIETKDRVNTDEQRILIFDRHGSHKTPLDSKPFLSYKQYFHLENNLSYWVGEPAGKPEFLRVICQVRRKAFSQRIIRESFKDRGIYPTNSANIVGKLEKMVPPTPEISTPIDLDIYMNGGSGRGEATPPPLPQSPQLESSSVEHTPPKTIQQLAKTLEDLTPKGQARLDRIYYHQQQQTEDVAFLRDTFIR